MTALRVLRDMAQPSDLPALLDLLLATPSAERDSILDTVTEDVERIGFPDPRYAESVRGDQR